MELGSFSLAGVWGWGRERGAGAGVDLARKRGVGVRG